MRLLRSADEVKALYLEHYQEVNGYLRRWINNTVNIKNDKQRIHISYNLLKSLSSLLDVTIKKYKPGYGIFDSQRFFTNATFHFQSEKSMVKIDPKTKMICEFSPFWYSDPDIIPKHLYDKILSLDLIRSIRSLSRFYHIQIDSKELDLSKIIELDINTKMITSDSLIRNLTSEWTNQKIHRPPSVLLDIIKIIHESFRELKDPKSFLFYFLSYNPSYGKFYLLWRFLIVSDTLNLFFRKSTRLYTTNTDSNVGFLKDYKVFVPGFSLRLMI